MRQAASLRSGKRIREAYAKVEIRQLLISVLRMMHIAFVGPRYSAACSFLATASTSRMTRKMFSLRILWMSFSE